MPRPLFLLLQVSVCLLELSIWPVTLLAVNNPAPKGDACHKSALPSLSLAALSFAPFSWQSLRDKKSKRIPSLRHAVASDRNRWN
jgi:hypothetical protein